MGKYVRLSTVKAYVAERSADRRRNVRMDDALLAIAALSQDPMLRRAMPRDFATQHDHYLYGTPKRSTRSLRSW